MSAAVTTGMHVNVTMPDGTVIPTLSPTFLAELVKLALDPLAERISALERQVKEMPPSSLADVFRGTWKADATYGRGELVTFHGSTWLCRERNAGVVPGQSGSWALFAQRAK